MSDEPEQSRGQEMKVLLAVLVFVLTLSLVACEVEHRVVWNDSALSGTCHEFWVRQQAVQHGDTLTVTWTCPHSIPEKP